MNREERNSLPLVERPVEKLLMKGAPSLSEMELIAILFGVGCRTMNVYETAANVYNRVGGLQGFRTLSIHEIMQFSGIGKMKASRIAAAVELGKRVAGAPYNSGEPVRSSKEIHSRFASSLSFKEKEIFVVLGLNSKHKIIIEDCVAEGCLNECPISPRDVFGPLLKCPAAAAILVHNHPSGDPSPSGEDRLLTIRMCEAGRLLGIKVLDHIIVGASRYYSFRDDGVM